MFKQINYRHLLTDLFLVVFSAYASLMLRVNPEEARFFLPHLIKLLPLIVAFRLMFFLYFETYNIIWRYVSAVDAFRLSKAILLSSLMVIASTFLFNVGYLPRSVYFIDAVLLIFLLSGVRIARRLVHEYQSNRLVKSFGQRTLIYGAGITGQGLVKSLTVNKELKLFVVGFIDDDPAKFCKSIAGFKVLGSRRELDSIIRNYEVKQIVIAIPNPKTELLREILAVGGRYGIKPQLMANQTNEALQAPLREVELKDLLRRAPHQIDLTSTSEMIRGKRVLITGAGGSIGSEIVRQVLGFSPSRMIMLDHSEFNLYNIDQELRPTSTYSEVVVPCLVDVKDQEALLRVFREYRPEIVFHAAAYKHVHLVETNPHTSILNNILGTRNVLHMCEQYEVENFVLISTDKAVNPAGVMGATKRICEIMTTLTGERTGRSYCAVRFGNVLGSSGSLIPLLKKQIEKNQPLTITHKDITRYFMLIEEAVSLVLKAASIANPGDINVLRMGEPVRVVDIASTLITLMGKSEEDVQIEYTGLRPGEKMFEELYISGNELNTEHPDILVVPKGDALPVNFSSNDFAHRTQEMIEAASESKPESVFILNELVNSNYKPGVSVAPENKVFGISEFGPSSKLKN